MLIEDQAANSANGAAPPDNARQRRATVAVVMANYNHARYLAESLGGIRAQTRPADEIIIIDDGSTDRSVEIIESFAASKPNVHFLKNGQRLGVHESISRAMPLVKSEYVAWTAADDCLLPHFLDKSMAALERHPEAGLCFSETTQLLGDSGVTVPFARDPWVRHTFDLSDLPEYLSPARMRRRMRRAYLPIAANTVVVRRDALLGLKGYPRQLEWHADSFAYTVIALRYGACVVPETLAVIRTTPGSYSHSMYDPAKQSVVLKSMLDLLAAPEYRDIRRAFRASPSNFSPGGGLMLRVQFGSVRDWDLFLPYLVWKVREYKRGHGLGWGGMLRHLLRRFSFGRRRRELEAQLSAAKAAHAAEKTHLEAERAELTSRLEDVQEKWQQVVHELNHSQARSRQLEAERDGFANALQALRSAYEATKASAEQSQRVLHTMKVASAEPLVPEPGTVGESDEPVGVAIASMFEEMKAGDPIYMPSRFWQHFNEVNIGQLSASGFRNFKLTANQNYHNFTPSSLFDSKIRRLIRLWRASPSLKPMLVSLERGYARLNEDDALRTQQAILGFSNKRMFAYQFFVSLLWAYCRSVDRYDVLDTLQEPELGNPIRVLYGDRLISQDLATSSREYNAIMGALDEEGIGTKRLTIAELGAGYGRLAHVFTEMTPCRYVIFDIPPALGVAQWYLTRLLPGKRMFAFRRFQRFAEIKRELQQSDIAFFTPNQMALFPDGYFDLTISISSLHEMLPRQIRHYLEQLSRLTREFLYLKQYRRYVNPYDEIVLERDIYKVPGDWETLFDRTEEIYTDFFELMQRRLSSSAAQG